MGKEIVKCVSHLLVRTSPPEALFSLFKEQLLLPEAWPIKTNAFFTTGGIHLGNLNLDIMQLIRDRGRSKPQARLYGIAFELTPYSQSLPELDRRGILHSPPLPFYEIDEQGWQVTSWTNVYLGGLLPGGPMARAFFKLSHQTEQDQWETQSLPTLFNRRFRLPFTFDHVYANGMTFAVEYNPAWHGINIKPVPDRAGLDIKQVSEVIIGARNISRARKRWERLLNPHPEIDKGVWQLPEDIRLRIEQAPRDGLLGMVWQAHSLNRSAQFLHRRGMLGKEMDGSVKIAPEKIQGLDIRIIQ